MKEKKFIVSLHDFHPGSREAIEEQVEVLGCLGVKNTSILVVPNFHRLGSVFDDESSVAFLEKRREAGDDLVLHGFYHQGHGQGDGNVFLRRFYTANEAEFLDLADDVFAERLNEGMKLWNARGWPLDGFIAPAWLMPERRDSYLRDAGFVYTTRLHSIELLQQERGVMTQSLCYSTRAWWRRVASLQWNPFLLGRLWQSDVIRLSLHPHDLNWRRMRGQIIKIVEMILAKGYEPLTYASYAKM